MSTTSSASAPAGLRRVCGQSGSLELVAAVASLGWTEARVFLELRSRRAGHPEILACSGAGPLERTDQRPYVSAQLRSGFALTSALASEASPSCGDALPQFVPPNEPTRPPQLHQLIRHGPLIIATTCAHSSKSATKTGWPATTTHARPPRPVRCGDRHGHRGCRAGQPPRPHPPRPHRPAGCRTDLRKLARRARSGRRWWAGVAQSHHAGRATQHRWGMQSRTHR